MVLDNEIQEIEAELQKEQVKREQPDTFSDMFGIQDDEEEHKEKM